MGAKRITKKKTTKDQLLIKDLPLWGKIVRKSKKSRIVPILAIFVSDLLLDKVYAFKDHCRVSRF